MARWEIIVLAVLVLGGASGWKAARNNLADRREAGSAATAQRAKELERAKSDHQRLERLAAEVAPAPELAGILPGATGTMKAQATVRANPAEAKTAAMTHVADLLQKGILASGAAPAVAGRPAVAPAYQVGLEGKLPAGFGDLFDLSKEQVSHLQDVVTSLKEQSENMVLNRTVVRQTAENSYTLELQPAADDGSQMRDQFVAEFKNTMGEQSYRLFAALNGERVADNGSVTGGPAAQFNTLLAEAGTMTITRNPNSFQYTLTSGARRLSGSGADITQITSRIGPVAKLLPPAFVVPFERKEGAVSENTVIRMESAPRGER